MSREKTVDTEKKYVMLTYKKGAIEMPRKYPKKQTRLDVYMPDEAIEMLRFLSEEHGMSMSAYVRALIRREWNASPHLHSQLKKDGANETD